VIFVVCSLGPLISLPLISWLLMILVLYFSLMSFLGLLKILGILIFGLSSLGL